MGYPINRMMRQGYGVQTIRNSRAAIGLWVMWLAFAGAACADDTVTLLATGSISAPSVSPDFQQLGVGDIMQLKYTIDPSIPTTVDGGPIVALWYSFNGSAFTDFFGNEFQDAASAVAGGPGGFYGWDLQPSHGAEAFLHVSLGDGAPAGIIPDSNLEVIPNWGLVAGLPPHLSMQLCSLKMFSASAVRRTLPTFKSYRARHRLLKSIRRASQAA
jgi:hypothetical protein